MVEAHATLVAASIADGSFEFLRCALPELYSTLMERAPPGSSPPPPLPVNAGVVPTGDAVLPVCVLDAAAEAPVLLEPAVEVPTAPAAALTATPLLARLASFLAGRRRAVTLYLREGRQVGERTTAAAAASAGCRPVCAGAAAADAAGRPLGAAGRRAHLTAAAGGRAGGVAARHGGQERRRRGARCSADVRCPGAGGDSACARGRLAGADGAAAAEAGRRRAAGLGAPVLRTAVRATDGARRQ